MARVKYGALITEIKGKVGGQVFQGGRSGGIIKNLGQPPKGYTGTITPLHPPVSGKPKTSFAQVTKGWSQLSQIQRDTWLALVGTWTFVDKFGDPYNGTPYQIFCACNMNALFGEITPKINAPAYKPALDMGYVVSDYEIGGFWTITAPNITVDVQQLVVAVSRPTYESKPVNSAVFNFMASQLWDPATPVDFASAYVDVYGYTPVVGSYFWVKLWCCVPSYPKQQFIVIKQVAVI